MTTNERKAFGEWWNLPNDKLDEAVEMEKWKKVAFLAWQARAALDQRQEVTDEMVSLATDAFENAIVDKRYGNSISWVGYNRFTLFSAVRAALQSIIQPKSSEVIVTKNEAGQIVAVTRQDDDGRVLEIIAESIAQPVKVPDGWKLVPVELTKNMEHVAKYAGGIHNVKKAWDAMLAGAPEYKP